jgi:hypothetical protein
VASLPLSGKLDHDHVGRTMTAQWYRFLPRGALGALLHYGKTYVCRASNSLPCALFRAHGKEIGCRVFFIQRTAKKKHTASKLFAVRQKKRTAKILFAVRFIS